MKLIEINQPHLIECDHCDFKIPNPTGDPNYGSSHYINMACPVCGNNLLTQKDHDDFLKIMKVVNFFNKWFSWLAIFRSNKKEDQKWSQLKVHKGVHIREE